MLGGERDFLASRDHLFEHTRIFTKPRKDWVGRKKNPGAVKPDPNNPTEEELDQMCETMMQSPTDYEVVGYGGNRQNFAGKTHFTWTEWENKVTAGGVDIPEGTEDKIAVPAHYFVCGVCKQGYDNAEDHKARCGKTKRKGSATRDPYYQCNFCQQVVRHDDHFCDMADLAPKRTDGELVAWYMERPDLPWCLCGNSQLRGDYSTSKKLKQTGLERFTSRIMCSGCSTKYNN